MSKVMATKHPTAKSYMKMAETIGQCARAIRGINLPGTAEKIDAAATALRCAAEDAEKMQEMREVLAVLDERVGPHESVEIDYLVDSYEAVLMVNDGATVKQFARGETITDALVALGHTLRGEHRSGERRKAGPIGPSTGTPPVYSYLTSKGCNIHAYGEDRKCLTCGQEAPTEIPDAAWDASVEQIHAENIPSKGTLRDWVDSYRSSYGPTIVDHLHELLSDWVDAYHALTREPTPKPTREPVVWRRWEDAAWIYYETPAWPDCEPLYASPSVAHTNDDNIKPKE